MEFIGCLSAGLRHSEWQQIPSAVTVRTHHCSKDSNPVPFVFLKEELNKFGEYTYKYTLLSAEWNCSLLARLSRSTVKMGETAPETFLSMVNKNLLEQVLLPLCNLCKEVLFYEWLCVTLLLCQILSLPWAGCLATWWWRQDFRRANKCIFQNVKLFL